MQESRPEKHSRTGINTYTDSKNTGAEKSFCIFTESTATSNDLKQSCTYCQKVIFCKQIQHNNYILFRGLCQVGFR